MYFVFLCFYKNKINITNKKHKLIVIVAGIAKNEPTYFHCVQCTYWT